jgi:putative ABC transport system permease protein
MLTPGSTTVPPSGADAMQPGGRLRRLAGALWRALVFLAAVLDRHEQNVLTALVQLWVNKARALLTTLGIIIAVTSTITVVSIVQGFGDYVSNMLRGFGTNVIFIIPRLPPGMHGRMLGRVTLDIDDVRAVGAECDKIRRISPLVFSQVTVEYGREKAEGIEFRGTSEQFQSIRRFFVGQGRFFGPIEVDSGAYVCVLGCEMLELLRCDESIVGGHVFINGQRFLVTGVLEKKGDMMGENQDRIVLIPYTTAVKMFPYSRYFMAFMVEATAEKDVDECSLQITRVMRQRHDLKPGDPNDFWVFRQDEFLRDFERVQMIATSILAGVVGISLIVGGIGIMNIMLVSVTERTREIGLRKSVGARRRDIMFQFLTEAIALAVLGGVIGVVLGYSICEIASMHPSMVKVTVPIWAVLMAMGFCAGVGVVFGMVPAFKAAILHPIDALRHE